MCHPPLQFGTEGENNSIVTVNRLVTFQTVHYSLYSALQAQVKSSTLYREWGVIRDATAVHESVISHLGEKRLCCHCSKEPVSQC